MLMWASSNVYIHIYASVHIPKLNIHWKCSFDAAAERDQGNVETFCERSKETDVQCASDASN